MPQMNCGLLFDANNDEEDNEQSSFAGGLDASSSAASADNYVRYGRDTLLALRCSSLVRPRPRYIDEAIAARRSFCRVVDLGGLPGAGSSPGGGAATSATAVGGAFGQKRTQTKTALTRGGGPGTVSAKADGEKSTGQDKQRRTISTNATGKGFVLLMRQI